MQTPAPSLQVAEFGQFLEVAGRDVIWASGWENEITNPREELLACIITIGKTPKRPNQQRRSKPMKQQLRALSIRQPYAEQILNGTKVIEYRSVKTNIRERVYIYASLSMGDRDEIAAGAEALDKTIDEFKKIPRGVLVGSVELVDCVGEQGDFEWHLENPIRFKSPLKPNPNEHPQPIWFYPFGRPGTCSKPKKKKKRKARKPRRSNLEIAREKLKQAEPVELAQKVISEESSNVVYLDHENHGRLGQIVFYGDEDPAIRVIYDPFGHEGYGFYEYNSRELRAIADAMDELFETDDKKPISKDFEGPLEA